MKNIATDDQSSPMPSKKDEKKKKDKHKNNEVIQLQSRLTV